MHKDVHNHVNYMDVSSDKEHYNADNKDSGITTRQD